MSDQRLYKVLKELESLGLKVCNLFQLHNGKWQANLNDGNTGYEFSHEDDPITALESCLLKARTSKNITVQDFSSLC